MDASIDLKLQLALLKNTDKESFEGGLKKWFIKRESFLNERSVNIETEKSHFTHKRLRNVYRSQIRL